MVERQTVAQILEEGERLMKEREEGEEEDWMRWLRKNGAWVLDLAIRYKRLRREE